MAEREQTWSPATKRAVILIIVVLVALVLYRFQNVIPPLFVAFLLAFILNPIVSFLEEKLPISRGVATGFVFFVLVLAMLGVLATPAAVVPSIQRAVRAIQFDLNRIITQIDTLFQEPIMIAGYELDLGEVFQDVSAMLRSFVSSVAQGTLDAALTIASGAFWLIFILIASFYMVKDTDRIVETMNRLAPPGYQDDFIELRERIAKVWHDFLIGELILGAVMLVVTTVVGLSIGLPYAVALGVLAGLMEFVPSLGPYIAGIPAVLIALLQGSTIIPLSNGWFALLVAGIYFLIQQIENNILVPRILGHSLNLHPLMVLIGIIVGGSLAGILGMLLAAPTIATIGVVGHYIRARLYDKDPFPEEGEEEEAPEEAEARRGFLERVEAEEADRDLERTIEKVTELLERARDAIAQHLPDRREREEEAEKETEKERE